MFLPFAIAVLVVGLLIIDSWGWIDPLDVIVFILIFAMVLLAGSLISILIGQTIPEEKNIMEMQSDTEIMALKDTGSANGVFFLGTGRIDSKLSYYYISEDKHGAQMHNIAADNAYIVYSDEAPHIQRFASQGFTKKLLRMVAIPCREYYVIYVPEGSIKEEFEIDME